MAKNDSSVIVANVPAKARVVSTEAVSGLFDRAREQRGRAVEHPEGDENADAEEGDELDDRLGRDREHQTVLMLGGVDVAGAEQHREGRHRQRDKQRHVAEHRLDRRRSLAAHA